MTVTAVCLLGLGLGRPPQEVVALAAVWFAPLPTLAVLAVLWVRALRLDAGQTRSQTALIMVRLASELAGGSTLRSALVVVLSARPSHASVVRLAAAGRPMDEVGDEMERCFGRYGRLVGASVRLTSRLGGSAAPVFEHLAAHVLALEEVARERRAAIAPGILQASIVGGVPVVALGGMVVSGRWVELVAGGGLSTVVVAVGTLLVGAGVAWVGLIVWRSTR